MSDECQFKIGDLVEYRSWYDGVDGWIADDGLIGVVLEIFEIKCDVTTFMYHEGDILYDVRVYWYTDGMTEVLPDMLLDHYDPNTRIKF